MNLFLKACEEGNLEEIKALLQTDLESRKHLLRVTDAVGNNCLHLVVIRKNADCLRYLLTFKELDINARNRRGLTIFEEIFNSQFNAGILSYRNDLRPEAMIEIVKMLFELNNDFINSPIEGYYGSPLIAAIGACHIDVVKLLINLGASVNYRNRFGNTALDMAARLCRIDCIRYLLDETDCDPNLSGIMTGWVPCCTFIRQICSTNPSREQVEFSVEFLLLTFKEPAETTEVYFMLLWCFFAKRYLEATHAHDIFIEIVKILLLDHQSKKIVEKILIAKLPSDFCLITLTLFEKIKNSIHSTKMTRRQTNWFVDLLEQLKGYFLLELFTLYLADRKLFGEFIAEIKGFGWTFDGNKLLTRFSAVEEKPIQIKFNFIKDILIHGIDILSSIRPSPKLLLDINMDVDLVNIFLPLSNFIHATIELMSIFGAKRYCSRFNFNESENAMDDYRKLLERKSDDFEVVSLKNLARMSVRKYCFDNYSHYESLRILSSLEIPIKLSQFLCYNYSNLKY